ncbi:MAG: hypothetical protein ACRD3M_09645 [Thermoanaerobaculia bacterium]
MAEARWMASKLDRGKSCIRFQKVEELPLDVIGKILADARLLRRRRSAATVLR